MIPGWLAKSRDFAEKGIEMDFVPHWIPTAYRTHFSAISLRRRLIRWSPLAVLLAALALADSPVLGQDGAVFRQDRLRVVTATQAHEFQVEIAETRLQRAQGLMWRRQLAPDAGMLFDFGNPGPVVMWMKNTYIPLDMMFVMADGTILNIARDTTPHSTDYIASAGPVVGVLEVAAGTVRKLGIRAGDKIDHPLFKRPRKGN